MIFISVGSLHYPFDRLFEYIDKLIDEGVLSRDIIFAQTGELSNYKIKHFNHVEYLSRNEFQEKLDESSFFITHCGTGSIISALERKKKTIVVPREFSHNEHQDNHQFELAKAFGESKYVMVATNYNELKRCILNIDSFHPAPFISNSKVFQEKLSEIIDSLVLRRK